MNKSAENLITAINAAFTADDIISDGATDWSLERLVDEITLAHINDDEDDEEEVTEYAAENGSVYEIAADGFRKSVPVYSRNGKLTPDHTYELRLREYGEDEDGKWFWCEVLAPNGAIYNARLHQTADGWENRSDHFIGDFPDNFDFDLLTDELLQSVYELPNKTECVSINVK